jgi:hypothetical protein
MFCIALGSLRSGSRAADRTVYAAALGWLLARTVVLLLRPLPIDHHDWERAETERVLRTVREAASSAPPGATVRIENQLFLRSQFILHFMPGRLPGWAGIFVAFSPDDTVEGRRVRFVVSDDVGPHPAAWGGVSRHSSIVARGPTRPGRILDKHPPRV